jgi:phospholipid/cholesterol/gamma-HCH transport system substrate-binding protein
MTVLVRRLPLVALMLVALGAAVLLTGGDEPYRIKLHLQSAGGLREGSDVVSGGINIGKVALSIDDRDNVVAELQIDPDRAPIGRDAKVAITAVNLLGQKRLEVQRGDVGNPAPSGYVVPARNVVTSTDLDQVVSVLDADTRTRLSILINEAGAAFTGRREDFNALLGDLPTSLVKARTLLEQVSADTTTLGRVVEHSDRLVASVTRERGNLSQAISAFAGTAEGIAPRRDQLRATLASTPGALRTLQGFMNDLERTTVPLGPAARDLTRSAPALLDTLERVEPFRAAAAPTLRRATGLAPVLTRLGVRATPVLRRAQAPVQSLADLGAAAVPVTDTLDRSTDNLLAVVENWSRAIQFRDGLSHVFRGEAVMSPETLRSLVERLVGPAKRKGAQRRKPARTTPRPDAPAGGRPTVPRPQVPKTGVPLIDDVVGKALDDVVDAVDGITGAVDGITGPQNQGLLDHLLGP